MGRNKLPTRKKLLGKIWEKKCNVTIAVNVLCTKNEKTYPAYVLKHNSNRKKRYSLNNNSFNHSFKLRKMALYFSKKIPVLLRRITSKHHGDFYCLNCLHSFRKENKHKSHKKVCENKDFYNIVMSFEDNKTLEFN